MITQNPTLQSQMSSQQTIINSLHETFNCHSKPLKQSFIDVDTINLHHHNTHSHPYHHHRNGIDYSSSASHHQSNHNNSKVSKISNISTENNYVCRRMDCQTDNNQSSAFSNILKINTSTYSVSRTTGCIAKRLQQASRRLQTVQTSISANKRNKQPQKPTPNKCNLSHHHHHHNHNHIHQQKQSTLHKIQISSQQQYMRIIQQQSQKTLLHQQKIQKLQQTIISKDEQNLKKQQKYLKKQKQYIMQINRLKRMLQEKQDKDNKYYNQKVEKERVVDQYQVIVWEIKQKVREGEEREKYWRSKYEEICRIVKMYQGRIQKEESNGKSVRFGRREHSLMDRLKELTRCYDQSEQNKQNISQLSNRGNTRKLVQHPEQNGTDTYRSITALKNRQKSSQYYDSEPQPIVHERSCNNNHKGWRTIQKEYIIAEEQEPICMGKGKGKGKGKGRGRLGSIQNVNQDNQDQWDIHVDNVSENIRVERQSHEDLYRCMLMQASLIQKLVI